VRRKNDCNRSAIIGWWQDERAVCALLVFSQLVVHLGESYHRESHLPPHRAQPYGCLLYGHSYLYVLLAKNDLQHAHGLLIKALGLGISTSCEVEVGDVMHTVSNLHLYFKGREKEQDTSFFDLFSTTEAATYVSLAKDLLSD